MFDVYTTAQMRDAEQRTETEYGIPLFRLMDNAGACLAKAALEMIDKKPEKCVAIFCGKGNNGGDGYVCAALLLAQGVPVSVYGIERNTLATNSLSGAAAAKYEAAGGIVAPLPLTAPFSSHCCLIVDALLGTGLSRPVEGLYAHAIETINAADIPILSCDLPSGINADDGHVMGTAINATRTLMLGLAKPASIRMPGSKYFGESDLADIGIPGELVLKYAPLSTPPHLDL